MKYFIKFLIIFYCASSYATILGYKDAIKNMDYLGNGIYLSKGSKLISHTIKDHVSLPQNLRTDNFRKNNKLNNNGIIN
jgi:hypothetical protein